MDKELKKKLEQTLEDSINATEDLGVGTKEHAQAVEDICKIANVLVDEDDKEKTLQETTRLKEEELKKSKIYDGLRIAAEVGISVVGFIAYNTWFKQGLEFEQEGVLTSTFFRALCNGLSKKGKV